MEPRDRIYSSARVLIDTYPFLRIDSVLSQKTSAYFSLPQSEYRVQSQNGEDGVLAEIFSRIGTESKIFVEFGIQNGSEGNCVFLADWCGWSGLFIEADLEQFKALNLKYSQNPKIQTFKNFVTSQNINELLLIAGMPQEIDLISIDVDGDDFWIWNAINTVTPRVVVIEMNGSISPGDVIIQPPHNPPWNGTSAYGASVAALAMLGEHLNYSLVHTEMAGVNAFFVRNDLLHYFPEAEQVSIHSSNHFLLSQRHPPSSLAHFVDLSKNFGEILQNANQPPIETNQLSVQFVHDNFLGDFLFPAEDQIISRSIRNDGIWEPLEVQWLKENVEPGAKCINVGANVGYFTCLMSQIVGDAGKVYSVEPNPYLIPLLKSNVNRLARPNVELFECAAGTEAGIVDLYLNERNFGDSRVFNPKITQDGYHPAEHGFDEIIKTVSVPIRRIDEIVGEAKIDVALIDTQGWDHQVLRGMRNIISLWHPKILVEFSPAWIASLGEDPAQVLLEYKSWGYRLGSPDLELGPDPTPQEVLKQIELSPTYYINISLSPIDEQKVNPRPLT